MIMMVRCAFFGDNTGLITFDHGLIHCRRLKIDTRKNILTRRRESEKQIMLLV
jgi:hypothetical protein